MLINFGVGTTCNAANSLVWHLIVIFRLFNQKKATYKYFWIENIWNFKTFTLIKNITTPFAIIDKHNFPYQLYWQNQLLLHNIGFGHQKELVPSVSSAETMFREAFECRNSIRMAGIRPREICVELAWKHFTDVKDFHTSIRNAAALCLPQILEIWPKTVKIPKGPLALQWSLKENLTNQNQSWWRWWCIKQIRAWNYYY